MSDSVLAALISAIVALMTGGITAFISWKQTQREKEKWQQELQRERVKWLTDLKAEQHVEVYKARLQAYPEILKNISQLSYRSPEPLTPEKAHEVAKEINSWLYSSGGLLASKETRGALIGIRETCSEWKSGPLTKEVYDQLYGFRDNFILLLRRDLDIKGLESYDFSSPKSVLDELNEEIASWK